ncbi:MAG: DEAD/DEAH box helicase [Spongiibacteraceae bacterium]|nr:DEAD/DEAH box helicase [Spongiibacteraceae bacterium]
MPDLSPTKTLFTDLPLDQKLQKTLAELNLKQATPVQAQTIPLALEQKDLLVSAQTGSGKTNAYLLPTLHQFLANPEKNTNGTRALILVPTRELAQQVLKHCNELTQKTSIKAAAITGGNDFKYQSAILRKNPEIVIATPGRLLELLEKGKIHFNTLEVLILDEADRILDMGFRDDVLTIINQCHQQRQSLLFSATLQHQGLNDILDQVVQSPEIVAIHSVKDQHNSITQQIILADNKSHKEKLLHWLLSNETYKKALIFTNTRIQAEQLGSLMRYHKFKAGVLHGEIKQTQRKKILQSFSQGTITVLVASDVAARGLDIKDVDLVINLDLPRNSNDYIHRIGRTGRAGEKGLAITLIAPAQWNAMISTERYLNTTFERRSIKGLKAKFTGPKKLKSSGKATGSKHKKNNNKKTSKPANKSWGNKPIDGFAPLKKKK